MSSEMDRVLYFILAGGRGERLMPLTNDHPKPLVRFGSSGRIIDFTLYNCLASGGGDCIVLTQYLSDQLERYLEADWKPAFESQARKLIVMPSDQLTQGKFLGTADAVYQAQAGKINLPEGVVVLAADHVYKMDYRPMIDYHVAHGGAATIGVVECDREQANRFGIIKAGDNGQIQNFHEKPNSLRGIVSPGKKPLASMGIYVFTARELIAYLEDNQDRASHDFGRDVIPEMVARQGAWAYDFSTLQRKNAYWRDIGELHAYWESSMEVLSGHGQNLDCPMIPGLKRVPFSRGQIIKKRRNGRRMIENSMIDETARIEGASIVDSVIGPGVWVGRGASIHKSVILDGARVGQSARLQDAVIPPHTEIPGRHRFRNNLA